MKRFFFTQLLVLFATFGQRSFADYRKKMVVCVPVADLRSHPSSVPRGVRPPALSKDMGGQISQLLYGECVLAEGCPSDPEWLIIRAVEQQFFVEGAWRSLSGYIKKNQVCACEKLYSPDLIVSHGWVDVYREKSVGSVVVKQLSMGTCLQSDSFEDEWIKIRLLDGNNYYVKNNAVKLLSKAQDIRKKLVNLAKKCIGDPYVWGGCSAYNKERDGCITSLDCSGLMYLVHKVCRVAIPRNSHSQFIKARSIAFGKDVLPGDLVFFSRQKEGFVNSRINHVMMYVGDGNLIESTGMQNVKKVRAVSSLERFGLSIEEVSSGQLCIDEVSNEKNIVFFGSFCD